MGRSPCCDGIGLKRGPWTPEEDQKLFAYIQENGHGSWRTLPQKAGLRRCGKSCRLRWINYLKPDIKRGKFTIYEEQTIIQFHALLGNRWSIIAAHLPNRTDNEIKNYWNTHLKKKLSKMGIDPVTHKRNSTLCSTDKAMNMSVIHHKAQWESTRLEAEARLAKESKLRLQNALSSPPYHQHDRSNFGRISFKPSFDILKAWQSGYGGNNPNAPPYTLSFLETAVEMLATRPSSNDLLRTESRLINTNATVDANIEGDMTFMNLSNSVIDCIKPAVATEPGKVYRRDSSLPCNGEEWNIEDDSYWTDIFNNPETLYSVVF